MKKMNQNKIATSIMALLLMLATVVVCLASCNGKKTNVPSTTTGNQQGTTDEPQDNYPDYNKRPFRVMQRLAFEYEFDAEGYNGDVINDAVYERNTVIENRYNIVMDVKSYIHTWQDDQMLRMLTTLMNSNEDAYDLVAGYQAYMVPTILNGWYTDWNEISEVDLKSDAWKNGINDVMTINNKTYAITGDLAITFWKHMSAMVFNKNMLIKVSNENIYDVVTSKRWTFSYMKELSALAYVDSGFEPGVKDSDDTFGFASDSDVAISAFGTAFGAWGMQKNASGEYEYTVMNDRNVQISDALVAFYKSTDGYANPKYNDPTGKFRRDEAMIVPMRFEMIERLKDIDWYGIIPYPMWDEQQETYYTDVVDGVSMMFVPKTAADTSFIGTITQALAEFNKEHVIPEYYELVLKGKRAHDEQSWAMLDIIRDGVTADFATLNVRSAYIGSILRDTVGSLYNDYTGADKTENFASTWEKRKNSADETLKKINEFYFGKN